MHEVEALYRGVNCRGKENGTGIIHQYVYASEMVSRSIYRLSNRFFRPYIDHQWQSFTTGIFHLFSGSMDRP